MKVVSRSKKYDYRFIVQKCFTWDGRVVQIGDEISIKEQCDQDGMVSRGMVRPADLDDGLIYISLRPFTLPGAKEKFEAKKLELVSLKAADAVKLMLEKAVLPRDPDQWRPFAMKLGQPNPKDQMFIKLLSEKSGRLRK